MDTFATANDIRTYVADVLRSAISRPGMHGKTAVAIDSILYHFWRLLSFIDGVEDSELARFQAEMVKCKADSGGVLVAIGQGNGRAAELWDVANWWNSFLAVSSLGT